MTSIIDSLVSLSGPLVYIIVGVLAFSEAAAFVGLVLPGETALFLGGVIASQGHVNLAIMLAVAVVAAIAGDSVGYEIGRRFGPGLKNSRAGQFVGADKWAKGEQFLARRGGAAVLLGGSAAGTGPGDRRDGTHAPQNVLALQFHWRHNLGSHRRDAGLLRRAVL